LLRTARPWCAASALADLPKSLDRVPERAGKPSKARALRSSTRWDILL